VGYFSYDVLFDFFVREDNLMKLLQAFIAMSSVKEYPLGGRLFQSTVLKHSGGIGVL